MSLEELGTAIQENTAQGTHAKTPVQLLNEYCTKNGIAEPQYVWSKEGDPFGPMVTCIVTVGNVNGTGEGTRKQQAKQHASAAAWALIQLEAASITPRQTSPDSGNPVGDLQELAIKKALPLPQYVLVEEQGKPHKMVFTMACQLSGFEAIATGSSKPAAKRGAALKVLEQLRQVTQEQEGSGLAAEGSQGGPVEETSPFISNGVETPISERPNVL